MINSVDTSVPQGHIPMIIQQVVLVGDHLELASCLNEALVMYMGQLEQLQQAFFNKGNILIFFDFQQLCTELLLTIFLLIFFVKASSLS